MQTLSIPQLASLHPDEFLKVLQRYPEWHMWESVEVLKWAVFYHFRLNGSKFIKGNH